MYKIIICCNIIRQQIIENPIIHKNPSSQILNSQYMSYLSPYPDSQMQAEVEAQAQISVQFSNDLKQSSKINFENGRKVKSSLQKMICNSKGNATLATNNTNKNNQTQTQVNKLINNSGFSNFPTAYQLIPIIYLVLSLVSLFLSFFITLSSKLALILIPCLASGLLAIIIYHWYKCTSIDPTDQIQLQHLRCKAQNISFPVMKYKYFCRICQTCVGSHVFHCKKCNRCVHLFDHHCRWLNNCIGAANYVQFIILIGTSWLEEGLRISLGVYLLVFNLFQIKQDENRFNWIVVWNGVMIVLSVLMFAALSYLCVLHLYLFWKNKSTVQLIMESRNANKIYPSTNIKNIVAIGRKSSMINININPVKNGSIKKIKNKNESKQGLNVRQNKIGFEYQESERDGKTPNELIKRKMADSPERNHENSYNSNGISINTSNQQNGEQSNQKQCRTTNFQNNKNHGQSINNKQNGGESSQLINGTEFKRVLPSLKLSKFQLASKKADKQSSTSRSPNKIPIKKILATIQG